MIGAIPNPTRELTVPFANEQVQTAMSNLSKFLIGSGVGNYIQHEYDNVLGQLELLKTEFLSLGVSIIVNSSSVNENQTKVNIEVRRAMGSFDKSYEVSEANRHIDKVSKGLSALLSNPDAINEISVEKVEEEQQKSSNKSVIGFAVVALWVVAYLLL